VTGDCALAIANFIRRVNHESTLMSTNLETLSQKETKKTKETEDFASFVTFC